MRFEDRLANTLASVLGLALLGSTAACSGDDGTDTDTDTDTDTSETGDTGIDLAGVCDGETPPENFQLATGFVVIEPGGECPDQADAQLQVNSCTFLEWQSITCGFDRVDRDQVFVDDGYGGYYTDVATAPTYASTDVVDVCYYEGVWFKDPNAPTCGRPLLRDGELVVAGVRPGPSGWAAGAHPLVADLSEAERAAVGAHWLESAVLEHASVASFAHFSLDLMRLGAPPELLKGAHQAALDEVEHARVCFALASGYHGAPLGPGDLAEVPPSGGSLQQVAEALVREGCIGETLAAIDAAARLAVATDPAVRAALQLILRDESNHAALAWRCLRWMLQQDADGSLRAHLESVFTEEHQRWTRAVEPDAAHSDRSRAHGLIGDAERARELARGWQDVIAPSWAALA